MVQYPRKPSFRVLAVALAVGAGISLLVAVTVPPYQQAALVIGIPLFLFAVADALFSFFTPAVTVAPWGISWRAHVLQRSVDLRYLSVASWSYTERRIRFATDQDQRYALGLAHLSEANREDLIHTLEKCLGAPQRAAAPRTRSATQAGRVRKGVRGALPPSGFQQWG